jgi:hypothetical protein
MAGACPLDARPYKAREDTKRSAQPADQALVRRAALTMEGRTEMPAFFIARTKGLFAAPVPKLRSGSCGDTMRPMMKALER